jgi:hypothetical protein
MKLFERWLSIAAWLIVTGLLLGCGRSSIQEVFGITLNRPVSPNCTLLDSYETNGVAFINIIPPKPSSLFKDYNLLVDATNRLVLSVSASSSEREKAVEELKQRYGQPDLSIVKMLTWTNAHYSVSLLLLDDGAFLSACASSSWWAKRCVEEGLASRKNAKKSER